ncbi:MAG: hypothetical protein QNJ78_08355 [Gammaproteobacteria bacterium]|nr:hypothetical protein [Gammaproteobacteria bacterium]
MYTARFNHIHPVIVLTLCLISLSGFAGTELKINRAIIDITPSPNTMILEGVNFDAFGELTVSIGNFVLPAEDCLIQSTLISCGLGTMQVEAGETWTVGISAGNAPAKNEEIDVSIPLGAVSITCMTGDYVNCYSADPATVDVGVCQTGVRTCFDGVWGQCEGEIIPTDEIGLTCTDGIDNDCDGTIDSADSDCTTTVCIDGEVRACYTGPDGTLDIGQCSAGVQTCSNGIWGACIGEVTPVPEYPNYCNDGIDNDCDNLIDDACTLISNGAELGAGGHSFSIPSEVTHINIAIWGSGGGGQGGAAASIDFTTYASSGAGGGAGGLSVVNNYPVGDASEISVGVGHGAFGGPGGVSGNLGQSGYDGQQSIVRLGHPLFPSLIVTAGGGQGGHGAGGGGGIGNIAGMDGANGTESITCISYSGSVSGGAGGPASTYEIPELMMTYSAGGGGDGGTAYCELGIAPETGSSGEDGKAVIWW